jgi:two-component system response regulator HydG
LNVLHIEIPPLAQRRQDIPFLARHFIERFCAREARALRDITPEGLERLLSFNWPGNVRELENMINRELVLNGDGALDFKGLGGARMHPSINKIEPDLNLRLFNDAGEIRTIEEMETQVIQAALDHFNHNITQAARALGISKSTLYRKLSEREKS